MIGLVAQISNNGWDLRWLVAGLWAGFICFVVWGVAVAVMDLHQTYQDDRRLAELDRVDSDEAT